MTMYCRNLHILYQFYICSRITVQTSSFVKRNKMFSAFLLHNQVNTNGVISFVINVNQYTPERFPLGDGRRLVAPFWGDADTRTTGKVFYRETSDRNLLIKAASDITSIYVECKAFRPAWLMIATWYEVPFFGASGNYTDRV